MSATYNPFTHLGSSEPVIITYNLKLKLFELFLVGGSEKVCEAGWTLILCSGAPCSYSTKSLLGVRNAVGHGCQLSSEARKALESGVDDPKWHKNMEKRRHAKNQQEEKEAKHALKRDVALVNSAKKKLTKAEFEAVANLRVYD